MGAGASSRGPVRHRSSVRCSTDLLHPLPLPVGWELVRRAVHKTMPVALYLHGAIDPNATDGHPAPTTAGLASHEPGRQYYDEETAQFHRILNANNGCGEEFANELRRRHQVCGGNNFPIPELAPLLMCIVDRIRSHPAAARSIALQMQQELILSEWRNVANTTVQLSANVTRAPGAADPTTGHFAAGVLKTTGGKTRGAGADVGGEQPPLGAPPLSPWIAGAPPLPLPAPAVHTYITPNRGAYPYASTMRFVARALDVLDLFFFSENPKLAPLQHLHFRNRFFYYYDWMLDQAPAVFLFPTCSALGATDLLRCRAGPLMPLGVVWDPIFVDEYLQSPCNFFWHDVNHARRIHQHNIEFRETRSFAELYASMNAVRLAFEPQLAKTETNKYAKLKKMLLFEVMHEDAAVWDWEVLWTTILLPGGNPFPYEASEDVDVPSGDGSTPAGAGGVDGRWTIKFYAESAPMLATFYNKLRHEFFEQDKPKEYIVEACFRTLEHVRNATLELLQFIKMNCSQSILVDVPGPSEVDALIRDQKYCETKHVAHPLKLPPDQSFEMGVAAPL